MPEFQSQIKSDGKALEEKWILSDQLGNGDKTDYYYYYYFLIIV